MIPNTRPVQAIYKTVSPRDPEKIHWGHMDVVAWSDDGEPLVVGRDGLILASNVGGYDHISEVDDDTKHVVPGGGWMLRYDNGTEAWEEPVVAWAIDQTGWGAPLTTDGEGVVQPLEPMAGTTVTVSHPDMRDVDPTPMAAPTTLAAGS